MSKISRQRRRFIASGIRKMMRSFTMMGLLIFSGLIADQTTRSDSTSSSASKLVDDQLADISVSRLIPKGTMFTKFECIRIQVLLCRQVLVAGHRPAAYKSEINDFNLPLPFNDIKKGVIV